MAKYIFVAGGVMSSVGKGIASAAIGKILQARGFTVTAMKIDPYVNVDAGTMNPTEHGETFVLDDGMECDQDMGNYERFLDTNLSKENYMTTGSVYLSVITKERNLEYGGRCIDVVPDIPIEVINKIERAGRLAKSDIVVVEIGGTVGDYQNILFLETVRILKTKKPNDVFLVLVSFLPALAAGGNELKTKPTQHAIRSLNAVGLHPDIIIGRAPGLLDKKRKEIIATTCGLEEEDIISAPNVSNIYAVPLNFEKDKLSDRILKKLNLRPRGTDLKEWRALVQRMERATTPVRLGIVGKYFGTGGFVLEDSYISVIEAIKHAAAAVGRKPEIQWLNSEEFERGKTALKGLDRFHGVIVPGGFGTRGIEGKIAAIRYCREKKIPYFGLCYGMQMAVAEFARHVCGMKGAHTTEIDPSTKYPVIDVMPEQKKNLEKKHYGATMRLGAYPAQLAPGSIAYSAYSKTKKLKTKSSKLVISERHRHRYEVNPVFVEKLEGAGMKFSGISPNRKLMEIMELPRKTHPFFLGTQFHPELKSRPLHPHPLFVEFLKAAGARRPR